MTIRLSPQVMLILLVGVLAAIIVPQLPEIQRYLKVKQM
jgi:uncharacterized protein DUF6893